MIKHTMYRCEYCKTEYANENDCKECEKNHVDYLAIDQPIYVAKCKYPTKIWVRFKDGKTRLYRA